MGCGKGHRKCFVRVIANDVISTSVTEQINTIRASICNVYIRRSVNPNSPIEVKGVSLC
jgi:hypothetical protein